jgi:Asp-tRNA(Asn)/Glu-tRNA(Gln) amidotransferase B subunit
VPLLELVTEPVLRTPEECCAFLTRLRRLVRWLGISDGDMEKGQLRCDANVSLRPWASDARHQDRAQEPELDSRRRAGHRGRDRAPAGGARRGGARSSRRRCSTTPIATRCA